MPKRINRWMSVSDEVAGPAKVYLYGPIGASWYDEGNPAKEFAAQLDALSPRDIDLYVNSEGGDVFEGYAMYAALNRYPGNVTAYVDGLAASAASYLILAANTVVMGPVASLMIHNCWSVAIGNASEMRETAERLDVIDGQIVSVYEKKSAGAKTADEFRAAMAAETWMTAEMALEWGLADSIEDGLKAAACISKESAKRFAHIPETVEVVDELPEVVVEEAPSDTTDIVESVETDEQELEGDPQERVVDRIVLTASGPVHLTSKE